MPSPLKEIYASHEGFVSDKWSAYLPEYDRLFSNITQNPISLLEIGIQNGGSLQIWEKYLPNAAHLIGCDINRNCERLSYSSGKINLVIGDIKEAETLGHIFSISPSFDIVIDDGSHTSSDIICAFCNLFPRIKQGGVFIAEDLHCSYWESHEGGLFHPQSSMAFFKTLADILNFEHWGIPYSREMLLQPFDIAPALHEAVLAEVHSVEFVNSMCIVTRRSAEENLLGKRHIAGQEERVYPVRHMQGTQNHVPPQQNNPLAHRDSTPDQRAPNEAFPSPPVRLEARAYWREKSDGQEMPYDENHSSAVVYEIDGLHKALAIILPEIGGEILSLRLDIANAQAAIVLHGLQLVDATGRELWRWNGQRDAFVETSGLAFFRQNSALPYTLFTLDGDPRFELKVPPANLAALRKGGALSLEITPYPLTSRLPQALQHLDNTVVPSIGNSPSLTTSLEEVSTLLQERLERKDRQISALQARLQELENGQHHAREQLLRAESQLELLKDLLLDSRRMEPL